MTLTSRLPHKLLVAALAFAATFAIFSIAGRHGGQALPPASSPAFVPATSQSTDARIASLQATVRAAPRNPTGYAELGQAYLQKVRETGDASFYARADGVLATAFKLAPKSVEAITSVMEGGREAFARRAAFYRQHGR